MRIWEVRLAHDDDTMIHVGSIYAWNRDGAHQVKQLAIRKYGDVALAVRLSASGREHDWDLIEP